MRFLNLTVHIFRPFLSGSIPQFRGEPLRNSALHGRGIMMKGRNIGTIALLGGSTAALAMLTGLDGARADDLKVNQQLLSERLDQLAAVGLQPGAGAYLGTDQGPAAGAPVSGGSFPRSILIPGTETSLKIYGQISEVMDYWMSGNPNTSPQSTTVSANGQ